MLLNQHQVMNPPNSNQLPYRPCAGMMVINKNGEVFVGKRIDQTSEAWQMPQGGIDNGEDATHAALRELEEEIGTSNVEIIAESRDWHHYDLPPHLIGKVWRGRYRGQKQRWFLMKFLGEDDEINIETGHAEFSHWKWVNPHDLPNVIVPFKRDLYRAILDEFSDYL